MGLPNIEMPVADNACMTRKIVLNNLVRLLKTQLTLSGDSREPDESRLKTMKKFIENHYKISLENDVSVTLMNKILAKSESHLVDYIMSHEGVKCRMTAIKFLQ